MRSGCGARLWLRWLRYCCVVCLVPGLAGSMAGLPQVTRLLLRHGLERGRG